MTHPTLGYANLRFAGDDAVHLPATPAATMTTACLASGSHDEPLPHDVDAPISCAQCLTAVDADWWMALMENERRTGEVTSLTGTLSEVKTSMARMLAQAEAVAEETVLGGGASLAPELPRAMTGLSDHMAAAMERMRHASVTPPPALAAFHAPDVEKTLWATGIASPPAYLTGPPIVVEASQDYSFLEDKVTFRARLGDAKAYEHAEHPVTQEKLDEVMESLARQLAASPLADLRRFQLSTDVLPGIAKEGPWRGEAPLIDPGAERVRKMIEAMTPRNEHGEIHDCARDSCAGMASYYGPCGGCCSCLGGCVYSDQIEQAKSALEDEGLPTTVHAAIETAQQTLEEHPFDEKCQRCNYDTHRCPGCGMPLEHGVEVCDPCNAMQTVPDVNWCHVHNRQAQPGREECSECDGERGEDQKAGES